MCSLVCKKMARCIKTLPTLSRAIRFLYWVDSLMNFSACWWGESLPTVRAVNYLPCGFLLVFLEEFWSGETLLCLVSIMRLLRLSRGSTIVTSLSCVNNKVIQMVKGPQQQKSTVKDDANSVAMMLYNNWRTVPCESIRPPCTLRPFATFQASNRNI